MTELTKAPQTKSLFQPAVKYPEDIFSQTGPDETQTLKDGPQFTTFFKGWRTRSEIYERILPDSESMTLRINGPRGGGCFQTFKSDGGIRIRTGPLNTEIAGSSVLGLYSEGGTNQKHLSTSYYEYNMGGTEGKGIALSIKATGDVVEECEGGQHSIKATKILITATDQLEIDAQNILIAAQGDLQLQGASVNTITVNEKDIVTGQKMSFGAGEETFMQFDPRAQVNIISPGSINMKAAQDFKLGTLGCISLFAVGGPGALVKNRLCGMSLSTRTQLAAGGTAATDIISSGFTTVKGTDIDINAKALVDIVGAEAGITALAGEASLVGQFATVKGTTQVKIEGAMIFLN